MNRIDDDFSMRLFFALWPDEVTRAVLAAWQPSLQALCGGEAMRADTLHSTLTFLGEVETHRLEALCLAAAEVVAQRVAVTFDVARYWGHNHIVYAAPQHVPAALGELQSELTRCLRKHHFSFDPREFKPHVTLLRHAKWTDAPLPEMSAVHWQAREFVLVCSLGDERGARYEVLARFGLVTP
jgi:2'-5' RNA ligase